MLSVIICYTIILWPIRLDLDTQTLFLSADNNLFSQEDLIVFCKPLFSVDLEA